MKENKKKVKKGFTLVELIVVIAIIGVLAMMITPSIMGYVNKAKISNNNASAKSIAMSAESANAQVVAEGNALVTGVVSCSKGTWGTAAGTLTEFDAVMKEFMPLDGNAKIKFDGNGKIEYVLYSPTEDITMEGDKIPEASEDLGVYKR